VVALLAQKGQRGEFDGVKNPALHKYGAANGGGGGGETAYVAMDDGPGKNAADRNDNL
jgi:hypothetical protein